MSKICCEICGNQLETRFEYTRGIFLESIHVSPCEKCNPIYKVTEYGKTFEFRVWSDAFNFWMSSKDIDATLEMPELTINKDKK